MMVDHVDDERSRKILDSLQAIRIEFVGSINVPFGCSVEEAFAAKREGRAPRIDEEWIRKRSAPPPVVRETKARKHR